MVGGIVLFAFGLETAMHDSAKSLEVVPALGLVGGIALYLLAHIALRLRIGGGLGRGRPIATGVLLVLLPIATHVPAEGAEMMRHREGRAFIRARRDALTIDDIARFNERRQTSNCSTRDDFDRSNRCETHGLLAAP